MRRHVEAESKLARRRSGGGCSKVRWKSGGEEHRDPSAAMSSADLVSTRRRPHLPTTDLVERSPSEWRDCRAACTSALAMLPTPRFSSFEDRGIQLDRLINVMQDGTIARTWSSSELEVVQRRCQCALFAPKRAPANLCTQDHDADERISKHGVGVKGMGRAKVRWQIMTRCEAVSIYQTSDAQHQSVALTGLVSVSKECLWGFSALADRSTRVGFQFSKRLE